MQIDRFFTSVRDCEVRVIYRSAGHSFLSAGTELRSFVLMDEVRSSGRSRGRGGPVTTRRQNSGKKPRQEGREGRTRREGQGRSGTARNRRDEGIALHGLAIGRSEGASERACICGSRRSSEEVRELAGTMTEVTIRNQRGMTSVKEMPILQDGPPPGGFPAVRYARRIPNSGPGGAAVFLVSSLVIGFGFYQVGQGNIHRRYDALLLSPFPFFRGPFSDSVHDQLFGLIG